MNVNLDHIAALAALQLTPAESEAMRRDLTSILDYVRQLERQRTGGAEPMTHVGAWLTPAGATPSITSESLREDVVRPSLATPAALANAPASAQDMFEVPKIVERG